VVAALHYWYRQRGAIPPRSGPIKQGWGCALGLTCAALSHRSSYQRLSLMSQMEATQQPPAPPAPLWSRLPSSLWPQVALHLDRPSLQSLLLSCSAPHAALHHNPPFTADWLVAEGARGALSRSPLLTAVHHGLVEVVAHMLRRGQGPADRGAAQDVLRAAARGGHVRLTELLLHSATGVCPADNTDGADRAHAGGPVGSGAVCFSKQEAVECCLAGAVEGGQLAVCEALLRDHGADAQPTKMLSAAAWHGHMGMCRLLLQHGAEVNAQALKDAAMEGHEAVVSLLLQHGAQANTHNGEALIWASKRGHANVVALLLQHGAQPHAGEALVQAACNGHEAVVSLLLQHGAQPHVNQALMEAAREGHADVVSVLLEHGAQFNGAVLPYRRHATL